MIRWLLKNLRNVIGTITAIGIIAGFFVVYAQLPDKVDSAVKEVEVVKKNQQTLKESVTSVNQALEKYIAVQSVAQETKEKSDKDYKDMLHLWIKAVSEK